MVILPVEQREVLLMRFFDGMNLQDIAAALNIPEGTVKSRLYHALQKLRDDPRTKEYFFGWFENPQNLKNYKKFLLTQAVLLCLRGVPGIYVHSIFGSQNDRDRVEKSGLKRDINRAKFEDIISSIVDKTEDPCKQALKDAKLKPSDIDHVVLVGGTTRMPIVKQKVEEIFCKKPNRFHEEK